jgi:hypothetical protein
MGIGAGKNSQFSSTISIFAARSRKAGQVKRLVQDHIAIRTIRFVKKNRA